MYPLQSHLQKQIKNNGADTAYLAVEPPWVIAGEIPSLQQPYLQLANNVPNSK